MQFLQKIREKSDDLLGHPAATVAFLGDSVTNGCFELYLKDKKTFDTVFERHNSYAERFVRMLNTLFPRHRSISSTRESAATTRRTGQNALRATFCLSAPTSPSSASD